MTSINENWLKDIRRREGRCPLCGGVLIPKVGKRGIFKSCIYFPACAYSRNLNDEELQQLVGDNGIVMTND